MNRIFILIALISVFTWSCEDQADVELQEAPAALVVDAWINNKAEEQVIRLTETQGYFDSSEPQGVSGASVVITREDGVVFSFTDNSDGSYTWDPTSAINQIGTENLRYTLSIDVDGQNYEAISAINRVPPVDSIKYTFQEEESDFEPEGYYGEFVATDPVGPGDTYWIKSYKNGQLLNRPFELNIAFDAGFNEGGNIDGVVFIQPIQDAVNPLDEDLAIVPYQPGDSLYVELHAIPNEAFEFLQQVQIQIQRDGGFDEIFAEPVENVITNIENVSDNPQGQVVGFFTMSNVSSRGRRLEE